MRAPVVTPAPLCLQEHGSKVASLLCFGCNVFKHVTPRKGKVTCLGCGREYDWVPRSVACASPFHNEEAGCCNTNCFKYRGLNPTHPD